MLIKQLKDLWKHGTNGDRVAVTAFHSQGNTAAPKSVCGNCPTVTCLWTGMPVQKRDVGQRPEILTGAAIFLYFSSDDELQANSKERRSGSTAGRGVCPILPVVKPLSVACDC